MSIVEAVVLGLVQGITEFLPISSTAHLRLAPELFGWADPGAAYSAIIQLGTVAAVVIYFWRDLWKLAVAFFKSIAARRPFETTESRLAWFVVLGSIPIGVLGIVFKTPIKTSLRSLYVIAIALIVLAIALAIAERLAKHQRTLDQMTLKDGLVIGFCQAMALVPGCSRSGSTLTGGLAVGLKREDAARYSFLLSIPATAAAGVFELREVMKEHAHPQWVMIAIGTVVAFGSGMLAIAWLLRFLRTRSTFVFVGYRIALGILLLVLLGIGRLQPQSGANVEPPPAPAKQTHD